MAARRPALSLVAKLLATWFLVGRMGVAPGTWGSLAALPFGWAIMAIGGGDWLAVAAAGLFVLGIWASERYATEIAAKDPGSVVVDEVVGQWIALIPATLAVDQYVVAFLAFRAMDIIKPWPAGWMDRRLSGGLGIMLDDVIAGIYAALLVLAYRFILS